MAAEEGVPGAVAAEGEPGLEEQVEQVEQVDRVGGSMLFGAGEERALSSSNRKRGSVTMGGGPISLSNSEARGRANRADTSGAVVL